MNKNVDEPPSDFFNGLKFVSQKTFFFLFEEYLCSVEQNGGPKMILD